jgi:MFS family permease
MGYLNWGWRSVYLLWIIPLLSILAALFKLDSPKGATRDSETISIATKTQNKKDNVKSLLTIGFIMFLVYTAMTSVGDQMISVFLPTYLTDVRKLSVSDASLVYGFASLTGVFAAPAGGYFADKLGRKTWLLYTVAAATICLFLAFLSPTAGVFIVFYFMNSFLTYSGMAASSAIIASLTPRSRRGMGYALSFLPGSLIGSVAPALAGVIGELMGLAFIFPIGIIAYSMALLTLRFGVARDSK